MPTATTNLSPIFTPITEATDGWLTLLTPGEYPGQLTLPGMEEDESQVPIIQLIPQDLTQLAASLKPGEEMLWDYEHQSLTKEGSTIAAAWITALRIQDGALQGQIRWSEKGRADVTGGNYRRFSVSLDLERWPTPGETNPKLLATKLRAVALTNRPNITTTPVLSNSASLKPETSHLSPKPMNPSAALLTALGLAATATEAEALAAIQALKDSAAMASNSKAEATAAKAEAATANNRATALLNELVEKDLTDFAPVIHNRDTTKAALLRDRDGTRTFLSGLKAPEPAPTIHNRRHAGQPAPATADQEALRSSKITAYRNAHPGASFTDAWAACKATDPSLFA